MLKTAILAIGRELLTGRVRDANASWLARRVTSLGGQVTRIAIVDDDPEQIARELHRLIQDGAKMILTTGGLGPTADDRTLEGIALALKRPLSPHPGALSLVKDRYQALAARGLVQDATLDEARRKMAYLPEGSRALPNPVGAAPGVLIEAEATIIALPGVPAEMEAIFETSVLGLLRAFIPDATYLERVFVTGVGDESKLAPILQEVMRQVPQVYLKSRATHFGPDVKLEVILSASGQQGEVEAILERAEDELRRRLSGF